jgi:Flp pilus assembly protein TadG
MRSPARRRDSAGSMAVEMVLLTPVLLMFTLLVVAGGRYVGVRGDIEAAARDAARAASLERDLGAATAAAADAATVSLDRSTRCGTPRIGGDFTAGGLVTVRLDCSVPYDGLGLIGLGGSVGVSASGSAPLDTYRRTG